MKWSEGIDFEVSFWDRWFSTKGAEWPLDYQRRLDPTVPFQPQFAPMIEHITADTITVLDVGAGPLTWIGKAHPTKKIEITPTDALGAQYDKLLEKYNVTPLVRTLAVPGENLTSQFGLNGFDLVYARNSVDHSENPFHTVCEMVGAVKPGAWICLQHAENEAEFEKYTGFHQWNFSLDNGDFIIAGAPGRINVTRALSSVCTLESNCVKRFITTRIRKTKAFTAEELQKLKATPFEPLATVAPAPAIAAPAAAATPVPPPPPAKGWLSKLFGR